MSVRQQAIVLGLANAVILVFGLVRQEFALVGLAALDLVFCLYLAR